MVSSAGLPGGDGHQQIYNRNRAVMSACGIDIRCRGRKLYLNYRTAEKSAARVATMHRAKGLEFDEVVLIAKSTLEMRDRDVIVAHDPKVKLIGWFKDYQKIGEMVNTTPAFPLQAAPEQVRGPEHPRHCGSGTSGEIGVESDDLLW